MERLRKEMSRPPHITIITVDEYHDYIEKASFKCPIKRTRLTCLDYRQECPERRRPCDDCKAKIRYDWARENLDGEKREEEWDKFKKACNENCARDIGWCEEPTYRRECDRGGHARLILSCILDGSWAVHVDPNRGMEIPL